MSDITYLLNFILNNGVKRQKSIWMKKKNYNELELIPSYVHVVTFAQANLPLSHLAFGWFTLGPYSNPPNPTGWRCTLFHPNWCSPPDKISLKGSKISKFRRTAIMPWHLYSGVLRRWELKSQICTDDQGSRTFEGLDPWFTRGPMTLQSFPFLATTPA